MNIKIIFIIGITALILTLKILRIKSKKTKNKDFLDVLKSIFSETSEKMILQLSFANRRKFINFLVEKPFDRNDFINRKIKESSLKILKSRNDISSEFKNSNLVIDCIERAIYVDFGIWALNELFNRKNILDIFDRNFGLKSLSFLFY